ncbi:carboxymuconolactone decarboxylase family protein [Nocardia beijingensis]|uniref:carboxymuconolactone decarboxylase family protein n=1 Tax=Nocardia beijingensis TaxID=95162 RepID=UPI001E29A7AD|nr:carboxymuconolactone decarboxylase family protein [Nocardia beijingensis]
MTNPAYLIPDAGQAIQMLLNATLQGNVPETTLMLAAVRGSQINGGSACLYADLLRAEKAGVTDGQLATVAAWRQSPYFTDAERAALALAEAAARMDDKSDHAVPDALWNDLAEHYDEQQRAVLILWIACSGLFNIITNIIQEPAGTTWS